VLLCYLLLFVLLLQDLLHVAESAADDLHTQLKRLQIDSIPGENVKTVSAVISSVARRIWFTLGGELPKDFVDSVLKVYQTSSVRALNVQFDKITAERNTEAIWIVFTAFEPNLSLHIFGRMT
jgi:hypothetical protein